MTTTTTTTKKKKKKKKKKDRRYYGSLILVYVFFNQGSADTVDSDKLILIMIADNLILKFKKI